MTFVPRPDDIYIVSYPRSGTTWLQMILYQLVGNGDFDFTHISEVVPFFERSLRAGHNLNCLNSPRLFKTHYPYARLPKQGRYIYVQRDGRDVLLSYFCFYRSHLGYVGSFDQFFERFLRGQVGYGSWFNHVARWRQHAAHTNCLWLCYEDLVQDLRPCLSKIADFCGQSIPAQRYATTIERCSFEFMKEHEDRFDHTTAVLRELGLSYGKFIRKGQVGTWRDQLTAEQNARFQNNVRFTSELGAS